MRGGLVSIGAAAMTAFGLVPMPGATAAATCPVTLPQGSDPVPLEAADFVSGIDNPYWPMAPGDRWEYRESDPKGDAATVRVVVKERTKVIQGITATVVHDRLSEDGEVVEDTFDWYAQDVCGNVWYLGENTKEFEGGQVVSTAGSWQYGVDGALAGVIVPADPQVGLAYRQEYLAGEAEDRARILSVTEQAQAPAGHFTDVLLTHEDTPVEPDVLEYKLYAPGVGPVLAFGISGGSDIERLVAYEVG